MSHKHANKEGGKGVHTQQSNQGGKDTSQDQVKGQKKSNSQQHDDTQSDSLDYQQGEKSKNIKPNSQKGEDNKKRAGGNPQPTQPTATDTQSVGSSPKPTASKPQETPTDTQTTVTSPQPTAAKPQETTTDTQTTVVSPQTTAAKSQQTATDTQTTVVSPQPTAAKSQPTTGETQPIGTSPQPTAADTQTAGVNPKPISDNLQQAGDNLQHKDLSETESEDMEEEGQLTMTRTKFSPKANTTVRRKAKSPNVQEYRDEGADQQVEEPVYKDSQSTKGQTYNNKRAFPEANPTYIRNRQPGIPENTKAGRPVRNDKKERTYGIPKQTGSRIEFSDDEQYDMTEANRIEKSRSRTGMDDWTNQLWISIINVIVTVIVCVLFMKVYPRWGQVQPVSDIDNSHATEALMAMKETIRDLRNEIGKVKTTTLDEATRRDDNLNEKFGELEKRFKTMNGTLEEIRRKIDNYSDKSSENRERIEQVKTDISAKTFNLEEKLRQQENNVKKTIQEFNTEVSKILREMDDKIKEIKGEMSSISQTIKEAEEAKKELQKEMKETYEQVDFLKANAFNKSVMLNLVVFLTIAVFALIIGMWILWNRVSFDHHGNTPRHGSVTNPRMSVIEQVPNHPLTNTICVISYGQRNESFNHTLVYKLMRQLSQPLQDTPVRGHLINTHADIANIPPCKLIFMCVEFSTRHVIIEEPGIGQGDIRRTTYDAVKKLGATLVILYTRDPESRQLGDKLRYQRNIYCVASQPELKVLDDQKCFYSVFTSFTQSQVESLEAVIRRALQ